MNSVVIDTHAVIWYLLESPKLSDNALYLNLPLVTRDTKITASIIQTIW